MPECNGYVERFHGLCDQFFWTRHRFTDTTDVAQHYPTFLRSFREKYAPERLAGRTPMEARQALPDGRVYTLPGDLTWTPGQSLPLVDGRVHCVRCTDSQGRLPVLGPYFTLGPEYRHAYIRATLTVADQQVAFYYQEASEEKPELVSTQPFLLHDAVESWDASLIMTHLA